MERRGLLLAPPYAPDCAVSHAGLPVVDGDRLYVAVRDAAGRARIARAPITFRDGRAVAGTIEPEPVLDLGDLGCFDDSGVMPSSLARCADGTVRLYYTGWQQGVSVPFSLFVGVAISDDGGETFRRRSRAPLLDRSDADPIMTASPFVLVEDGRWRMWYVSCDAWSIVDGRPQHRYNVRYAESADGLDWRREGQVAIPYADAAEYAISRPFVERIRTGYRMWFSSRGDVYRIRTASSPDGSAWTREDAVAIEPSGEGWDAQMACYPFVEVRDGRRYVLYNGSGFGATGVGYAVDPA